MHATLPAVLLAQEVRKRIEDMDAGEEGSVMPYAMAADSDDRLWLDPGALVTLNEGGTFTVKKTAAGYEIAVSTECCYRWERGELDNKDFDHRTIPVAKISVIEEN